MDSKLNKMVEEILDRKRREMAEEIATKLFEAELTAVSLTSAIPVQEEEAPVKGKPPIKEQLPLDVEAPRKSKSRGAGPRSYPRKRRPYNEMLCLPAKGKGPYPNKNTTLFSTYETAKSLLSPGPACRVELTTALKDACNVSYFTASKHVSILMDRELIVPAGHAPVVAS